LVDALDPSSSKKGALEMTRLKLAVGLAVLMCAYGASVVPAFAVREFSKVGSAVKTTDKEASVLTVNSVPVSCANSSGKGTVASTTAVKITVTFEKCKVVGLAAKMTPCTFTFNPAETLAIETGCTVTVSSCEIKVPSTKTTQLKLVEYANLKEAAEESFEPLLGIYLTDLTYEANAGCETLGVKKGTEGVLESGTTEETGLVVLTDKPDEYHAAEHAIKGNPPTGGLHIFNTAVSEFKCSGASLDGSGPTGGVGAPTYPSRPHQSRVVKVIITYTTCTDFTSGEVATITGSHCAWSFDEPADLAEEAPDDKHETKVGLVTTGVPFSCTFEIKYGTPACVIVITSPTNESLSKVSFLNIANNKLEAKFEVAGIKYVGGTNCRGMDKGTQFNGKYKGIEKLESKGGSYMFIT
jgi:hypothetical protein